MKFVTLTTLALLTACEVSGVNPAFKDVQRQPPDIEQETALFIVQNERQLAVWIAETRQKCREFGCVGANVE